MLGLCLNNVHNFHFNYFKTTSTTTKNYIIKTRKFSINETAQSILFLNGKKETFLFKIKIKSLENGKKLDHKILKQKCDFETL